jgi:hypothetical protein
MRAQFAFGRFSDDDHAFSELDLSADFPSDFPGPPFCGHVSD